MAYPTITFNTSTGSDTQASGAGPATALFGTNASFSGSVVTLDGSPDLSGVAVDSSHVLWLQTSTGRQFFAITAKDDGADTVTVADAPAGTSTGRTWGIGGKRATLDATTSRLLLTADLKHFWKVLLETDQTITSSITLAGVVASIEGDSVSAHRVITQSSNAACFSVPSGFGALRNLKLQNTNGTKTSAHGITASGTQDVGFFNCIFGDATNKLANALNAVTRTYMADCYFAPNATGYSQVEVNYGEGAHVFVNCYFKGAALYAIGPLPGALYLFGNVFDGAGSSAIRHSYGATTGNMIAVNNVFVNNGGSGWLDDSGAGPGPGTIVVNNIYAFNSAYGIDGPLDADINARVYADANDFYSNTSGARTSWPTGSNDQTVDPGFTDKANNDMSIGTALKALGLPLTSRFLGANQSATKSYVDIGASQRQEAGGGGPLIGGRLVRL